MATPTIFTPIAVDPVLLTPTLATILSAGANGAVLDYLALVNAGPADFASVLQRDISVGYTDRTAVAASIATGDVPMFVTAYDAGDEFYVLSPSKYAALMIIMSVLQIGGTALEVAYGTTAGNPGTYTALTAANANLVDGTNLLKQSGEITFDPTSTQMVTTAPWVTTTPNGVTAGYAIRLKMTAGPITTFPVASQIRCGSNGGVGASVYYVPSGGTAGDSNTVGKGITVPGDGEMINIIRALEGRPWHMEPSSTIQGRADQPQVAIHIGGTDYA